MSAPKMSNSRVVGSGVLVGKASIWPRRVRGDVTTDRQFCWRAAPQTELICNRLRTDFGGIRSFSGIRWGVAGASCVKTRKPGNGAGFRFRKSLHMSTYRKLG